MFLEVHSHTYRRRLRKALCTAFLVDSVVGAIPHQSDEQTPTLQARVDR